jgi:hypothetical protein
MPLKEKFVGTWTLLSWKIEQAGGEIIDSRWDPILLDGLCINETDA